MPVPYPEVFRSGGVRTDATGSRKRYVSMLVICLNYLHCNRPSRADVHVVNCKKLSACQWRAVRHLEHLCQAWFEVSPVGPEEMGRAAAKVETLAQALSSLE